MSDPIEKLQELLRQEFPYEMADFEAVDRTLKKLLEENSLPKTLSTTGLQYMLVKITELYGIENQTSFFQRIITILRLKG